jgi:predicted acetyltransferase
VSWPVRNIEASELREFVRVGSTPFGHPVPSDEDYDDAGLVTEIERSHVALDGDAMVGTAGAFTFDLTVPGGATLAMAGVTDVAVLPTHRRRGVLTALMRHQLDDVVARGEAIAGLTASEGGIYRRFGYGVASRWVGVEIDTRRSTFRRDPQVGGRLRIPDAKEPWSTLAPVWDAYRTVWSGALTRSDAWWQLYERDRERWRDGASRMFRIVHEGDDGVPDGYVLYRMKREWDASGSATGAVVVDELLTVDPEVEAALWRAVLDVDLTVTARARGLRVDDPLQLRFVDQRCVRTTALGDHLWVRLLDVPRCLETRTYAAAGALVLVVTDGYRPGDGGVFALEADGAGERQCGRTTAQPDLVLDTADLAAAYLGTTSFRALREAGLVDERADGAVTRADAMFRTERAPWCLQDF